MKVFEDVDIEFFDPMLESPVHREEVIIILKTDSDACIRHHLTPPSGDHLLLFATFKENMTVSSKYMDRTGYSTRAYVREQIKCWGRLKRS